MCRRAISTTCFSATGPLQIPRNHLTAAGSVSKEANVAKGSRRDNAMHAVIPYGTAEEALPPFSPRLA